MYQINQIDYHLTSYFESIIVCFEIDGNTTQIEFSKIPRHTLYIYQAIVNSYDYSLHSNQFLFFSFFFVITSTRSNLRLIYITNTQVQHTQVPGYSSLKPYTHSHSSDGFLGFFLALTLSYSFSMVIQYIKIDAAK